MLTPADRELARHWREWSDDTGREVVRCAELRVQGIGDTDMRTLLWFAFMAGWYARRIAQAHIALGSDSDRDKARYAARAAVNILREVAE